MVKAIKSYINKQTAAMGRTSPFILSSLLLLLTSIATTAVVAAEYDYYYVDPDQGESLPFSHGIEVPLSYSNNHQPQYSGNQPSYDYHYYYENPQYNDDGYYSGTPQYSQYVEDDYSDSVSPNSKPQTSQQDYPVTVDTPSQTSGSIYHIGEIINSINVNSYTDSSLVDNPLMCYKFYDDGSQVTEDDAIYDAASKLYKPKDPSRNFKVDCEVDLYIRDKGTLNSHDDATVKHCTSVIIEGSSDEESSPNDDHKPHEGTKIPKNGENKLPDATEEPDTTTTPTSTEPSKSKTPTSTETAEPSQGKRGSDGGDSETTTPQPDGAPSGTIAVRRGKGHDVRKPSYWARFSGNDSGSGPCSALANEDNLKNPFLYMSNVARCQENIQTALTWNENLEKDATGMAEAAVNYVISNMNTSSTRDIELRDPSINESKSVRFTEFGNDWRNVVSSRLGGTLHAPIPYRGEDGVLTNSPTGQNLMIGQVPLSSFITSRSYGGMGGNTISTSSYIMTQSSSISRLLSGDVDFNDVEVSLSEVDERSEGIVSRMVGLDHNDIVDPVDDFPRMKEQVGNYVPIYHNDDQYYPISYLRSQYLGGISDKSDIKNATLSLNEYFAAKYYIDLYLREGDTIDKTAGGRERMKNSPSGQISSFNSSTYPIGHFTQMVWASTTEVGCGTYLKQGIFMTVCSYYPAGNVSSQIPSDASNIESNAKYLSIDSSPHYSEFVRSVGTSSTESMKSFLTKFYRYVGGGSV